MTKPPPGGCPQSNKPWLWYCQEHDLHGDARSEEEARAYADAHLMFANRRRRRSTDDNCADSIVIHDCRQDQDFSFEQETGAGESGALS